MKKTNFFAKIYFVSFFFGLLCFSATEIKADGFIIPQPHPGERIPPLSVKYHRVSVEIINQVAKTSIDQVFINNHNRDIEGAFIFPLPEKAAVSEFSMYVEDKQIEGEILDSEQARKIYKDIVRRLKDPALFEYIGRNMFRARVYPIRARGEKRIRISYTEILKSEGNLVRYIYSMSTERFSLHPLKQVVLTVEINSQIPISNIYSPSHKVSIRKESEKEARVSFEAENIKSDKDFVLYYSLTPGDVGLSVMNWEGPDDKYLMLLASPAYVSQKEKIINKNIIFVLDSSGSMSGKKIIQAKEAARFVINHLEEKDQFSIVDFDDGVTFFSSEIIQANSENREKALRFVEDIQDSGGTNINDALLRAFKMLQDGDRPNYILFLTDGLPTVGITDTTEILKNIRKSNDLNSRVFIFGVGYDVNTELLDRVSSENRGTSIYVSENENLEVAISNFYEKISSPLLSDLKVDFTGITVKNIYPQILPDLFKGSQLVLIGRYQGNGPVSVILSGRVGKEKKRFVLKNKELIEENAYSFLARLWAARRIGYLLEEIRLHGSSQELVDAVKKLGLKYGIITPYTSYLVTERERLMLDAAAPEAMMAFEAREVSGAGAVKIAKATQSLKGEEQIPLVVSQKIRYKEDKTFYLKDKFWVDSDYEEGSSVKEILFNSEEYFTLIDEKPELAKYLSVGTNVIFNLNGLSYKIISDRQQDN
ncbi:VIT domain-containing protein [Acidobacteriota bacterium]